MTVCTETKPTSVGSAGKPRRRLSFRYRPGFQPREPLGEIYEWAGQYRSVELAKGGFRWPPAYLIPDDMARFEAGLLREHTPCCPAPLPTVARRIAEIHAELLLIHPFREGNGRLARWLADLMALQARYAVPDYGFVGRGSKGRQERYLQAVKRGYLRDYNDLVDFFRETVERRVRALG